MALVLVHSIMDNQVRVFFDVDAQDRVTALRCENDSTFAHDIQLTRPSGQVWPSSGTYQRWGAGESRTDNLPPNRRFRYSDELTSDWRLTVTTV